MKTAVVKIGNSKGIRIPKTVLDACHIEDQVDLLVEKNKIIIIPFKVKPRGGWEAQFKEMALKNDDKLIIPDSIDLELRDWEW
ncbi:AbrB/MazE/SpoVT family DNA-binding domain-containing protein [Leptospira ilyithenensis]|uniref:AbrB/MazE/SpoVT family DNA-binding domain-containing protein n=1 Tax=Leptospira ilyithenensis TaxID=2484901 RepID=A0A4R9LVQ5_9LEPT|nr:AbrB/MazE/SpoVT family DNA-binding domain-containing protein [Leptospira ilyithenensis]TGN13789.1 AbrB/MazE/SpoVT family DNA-binding domain-containing protein [Leptospira ilyithenensis]